MQQLTGLDTSFLNMETATTYGHISGLALFDPSTAPGAPATIEDVKQLSRSQASALGALRDRGA